MHGLERHLHLDRLALRPARREERLLQLLQQVVRRRALVRGSGQLVDVEQLGGAEPLLEPGVEGRAAAGVRVRRQRERAAQPRGEAGGIGGQLDEPAHRQLRGQRDDGALVGGGALGEQHVDVGGPAFGVGHRLVSRTGAIAEGLPDERGAGVHGGGPGPERVDRPRGRDGFGRRRVPAPYSGSSAQCSTRPAPVASTVARISPGTATAARGRSPVGPHRCPDSSSTRSARVTAT